MKLATQIVLLIFAAAFLVDGLTSKEDKRRPMSVGAGAVLVGLITLTQAYGNRERRVKKWTP